MLNTPLLLLLLSIIAFMKNVLFFFTIGDVIVIYISIRRFPCNYARVTETCFGRRCQDEHFGSSFICILDVDSTRHTALAPLHGTRLELLQRRRPLPEFIGSRSAAIDNVRRYDAGQSLG